MKNQKHGKKQHYGMIFSFTILVKGGNNILTFNNYKEKIEKTLENKTNL